MTALHSQHGLHCGALQWQGSVQVRDVLVVVHHVSMAAQQVLGGEKALHSDGAPSVDARCGDAHLPRGAPWLRDFSGNLTLPT